MSRTIPKKDADFMAWADNLNTRCTANKDAWQLNATSVSTLNTLTSNAKAAYQANLNPETTNRHTTANKRVAFDVLKRFLSTFIYVLVADELISENDLEAMGLPSREHHYHAPIIIPPDAPDATAVVGQHHDITVYVAIPQHGQPTEYLKKEGYYGFVVRYKKEGDVEWREEHSTRLHITLLFDNEDEGKHLTLTAAWINPRIQHGPWSDEISVLIN